ncbi:hypothetical protein BDW60DRAFT_179853 [Aspergillus nidulans var. acristatus]
MDVPRHLEKVESNWANHLIQSSKYKQCSGAAISCLLPNEDEEQVRSTRREWTTAPEREIEAQTS